MRRCDVFAERTSNESSVVTHTSRDVRRRQCAPTSVAVGTIQSADVEKLLAICECVSVVVFLEKMPRVFSIDLSVSSFRF